MVVNTKSDNFNQYIMTATWNIRSSHCGKTKARDVPVYLCISTMWHNFDECNNGGKGGAIE